MLGHQPFDFCEDLACRLFVLTRKSRVNLDGGRDTREETRVGSRKVEVYVGQNSQTAE